MAKFGNRFGKREDGESSEPAESSAIVIGPREKATEFFVEPVVEEVVEEDYDLAVADSAIELTPEEAARASDKERLAAALALKTWMDDMDDEGVSIRNREILERLHMDIRANRKMNEWGSFPLDDLLRPPMQDFTTLPMAKIANVVTVLRNLLLFVPVMVTWLAIERAATAYNEPGNSGKTFLAVWNDIGLSLKWVALLDFVVIAALIALTLASHLLDAKAEKQARSKDEESDVMFRTMMVNVGLYLHGFRQITPSALKGGLADAVNQLKAATDEMKDAAVGMNVVADKAASTLAEFATMSAKEFTPAAERLAVLVGTLETAATSHTDMGDLVKVFQAQLSGTIGSLEGSLKSMTKDVVDKLNENARSLEVALVQAGNKIDAIGSNLQGAAATTSAAMESMAIRRSESRDR
jgi:uncharacterized protein YukE